MGKVSVVSKKPSLYTDYELNDEFCIKIDRMCWEQWQLENKKQEEKDGST